MNKYKTLKDNEICNLNKICNMEMTKNKILSMDSDEKIFKELDNEMEI